MPNECIIHSLMRLQDAGIVQKMILDAVSNSTECLKSVTSVVNRKQRLLELNDFYGVFSLYTAGKKIELSWCSH